MLRDAQQFAADSGNSHVGPWRDLLNRFHKCARAGFRKRGSKSVCEGGRSLVILTKVALPIPR